jgi:hypothetical protein
MSVAWTRWLFLRLFGLTALVAVGSFWSQLSGLIGSQGIWPAAEMLAWHRQRLGGASFTELPTLAWLSASDGSLHLLAALTTVAALLLAVGVAPRVSAGVLWLGYLSLVKIGGPFLSFQWDVLLIETAFLAMLFAPAGLLPWPTRESPPSRLTLFLLRFLSARLMLLSGLVKILSGDTAWRTLTAFRYHYWTQPLPTWTSHITHYLPDWVHTASCAVMFVIELVLPFFAFGPRLLRLSAFAGFAGLQLALIATGNYSFFNWLSLALCVPLLDDRALQTLARRPLPMREGPEPRARLWKRVSLGVVAALLVTLATAESAQRLWRFEAPAWVERLSTFHTANSYGAFAVMTKTRPEIIVEGSRDGLSWQTYEFPYKPGAVDRRPEFIAPLQPRLDWQMWFAALGQCNSNPWFIRFQQRLLEGSAPVISLLEVNPFGSEPPRYLRSTVYQYRFSTPLDRHERGVWWQRERQGPYCPTLTLQNGQLQRVGPLP